MWPSELPGRPQRGGWDCHTLPRATLLPAREEPSPPGPGGGNPVGGGKEATHKLLSLAPAPDHSPHPPPRPRARHDLILCSKTPPCLPGSSAFTDWGPAWQATWERWDSRLTAKTGTRRERQEAATHMLEPVAFIHAPHQVEPETPGTWGSGLHPPSPLPQTLL